MMTTAISMMALCWLGSAGVGDFVCPVSANGAIDEALAFLAKQEVLSHERII
jgi:hypothetical protein